MSNTSDVVRPDSEYEKTFVDSCEVSSQNSEGLVKRWGPVETKRQMFQCSWLTVLIRAYMCYSLATYKIQ